MIADGQETRAQLAASPPARPAFVGRLAELAELRRAVDALRTGHGSLYLVTGEPGIGKTRLSEELAALAAESGVRVLWGRCHEAEGRPPYLPWAQIVQACARDLEPAAFTAALIPDAVPLVELIPELRPHLQTATPLAQVLDPETARFRLFQALTLLLRRIAVAQPLLLILDDLHWADLPSLRMLEFIAHELADAAILVVGTFREVEVRHAPAVADVIARLGRRGRRFPLAGFTKDEVSRFVETAAGQPVPEALAQRLLRDTEGNPFFLDEIVRLFHGDGAWLAPPAGLPVSQGVRGAIRQRLAPLAEPTRRLLSAAAVVGREFDLPLIEAALHTTRMVLLDQLAPAVDIEILSPVAGRAGRYRFSHALVREMIYDDLPPAERAALHRRFGNILEERHQSSIDAHLPELAHHFYEASAGGGEEKAIDYAERAGRDALRLLAYEEASEQLLRALHLSEIGAADNAERECELLLCLAGAKNRAGQSDESAQACHRAAVLARRIGSPALLARAATGLCDVGVAWTELGRSDDTLVRILEEALRELGPQEDVLRARVMARLATELFWARAPSHTDALSAEAVALARQAGDGATLAYTLLARIHCLSDPDAYEQRRVLIDEVLALTGGRGELAVNAYLWRSADEMQFGQKAAAQANAEKLIHAVRELRQPRDLWMIPAIRSRQTLLEGRLEDAEREVEQILDHASGVANAEQTYLGALFFVRREQGRIDELTAGLAAFVSQSSITVWRTSLTLLYAETGDFVNARAEMDVFTSDGLQGLRRDLCWLFSVASLAEACHLCGSREQAALLYKALLPYDGNTVTEGLFCYFGPVSYYLGILAGAQGDDTTAIRHLHEALTATRAMGARPFTARILLAQAQISERDESVDAASAAGLRRQAGALAEAMGMKGVVSAATRPIGTPEVGAADDRELRATLRHAGDYWVLTYKRRTSRMKAIKGFHHLARLLRSPGREFHVLDMTGAAVSLGSRAQSPAIAHDLGPLLDARAKAEIQHRLDELHAHLEEAERNNDSYRAEKARAEIEQIREQLASAVGLGGRDRVRASDAERARAAVTKAIRAAIQRIERCDPALADILSVTVHTGSFCSYVPLAKMAIIWDCDEPENNN